MLNPISLHYAPHTAFDIVVMAASTGGLTAVTALIDALPAAFPVPILFVQHRSPQYAHLLPEILRRRTPLLVQPAEDGEPLRPGTIYLAPPDRQLSVTSFATLRLREPAPGAWPLPRGTADPLFASVAAVYGARAIGVILSGRSTDGAKGCRALKQAGGRVLVQAPETAEAAAMPAAALATGCADFALPPRTIAHALVSLVMVPGSAPLFYVPENAWGMVGAA